MGGVKKTLRAATLVEVIVASVVFMTVFAIAMHTVSRLSVQPREGVELILAERAVRGCVREFSAGNHEQGNYERVFGSIVVHVELARYRDYDRLQELTVWALVNHKRLVSKHVIERCDE